MITTVCKISYGSQTVPPIVPAVQGDTGRAISFEIADFTPPAGATATYFILKPSGEAIYNSATITDNSILCELTAQSLAEAGENRMQVRVLQGEDIVTSFEVILMVRTFLGDDAIESGTEMNIFDQAVEQATDQFQENAEQIVEEVIESIPADYTALTEEVSELNERLGDAIEEFAVPTQEAVDNWLNNHPEATTTVEDGSLTESKFSDALKLKTVKDYITPEMFGAVGDGITDDSDSLADAIKYSVQNGTPLYLLKKYRVTKTLIDNTYSSSITLRLVGNNLYGNSYRHSADGLVTGAIICDEGVNLFSGLKVYGYMKQVSVVTTVTTEMGAYTTGSVFYKCTLSEFQMVRCSASKIGSIFIDCEIISCSMLEDCKFININCFAKCTERHTFTDSVIKGCYINGGKLSNSENDCFMWTGYNGSSVVNCFIDFYRCIYNSVQTANGSAAQTPQSIGNHYQVFLYLYNPGIDISGTGYIFGSFANDVINWTDPNASAISEKMAGYTKFTYRYNNETYDVPENILTVGTSRCAIKLENIKLENNLGNLVFVFAPNELAYYHASEAKLSCVFATTASSYNNYISKYSDKVLLKEGGVSNTIATNSRYMNNIVDIPFITRLDSLPTVPTGSALSQYYAGQRIEVNHTLYRLLWDNTQSKYAWKEINPY